MAGVGQRVTDLFAQPGGWATRPMAQVLNFFNRESNRRVAAALELGPGQRVLEVGFGGGAAIPMTTEGLGHDGVLVAVDLSPDMAGHARVAFGELVGAGRLQLACADVGALPIPSATIDHAYAVHSHLYWPEPEAGIRELLRVLRPGGRLLLAMDTGVGLHLIKRFGRSYQPAEPTRLASLFSEAGFAEVRSTVLTGSVVAVIGSHP